MDKIEALAAQMGMPLADVAAWVECLRVWTAKGYSVEEAIAQNEKTLISLLDRTNDGLSRDHSLYRPGAIALKSHLTSEVWEAVNAVGG